jgi:osmotically-inducible protein OsmY
MTGAGGQDGGGERTSLGAERTTFAKGDVLSHTYQIEKMLARGGMGEVYKARHMELGTLHAVKIILPDLASNERVVNLFRREAAILRNVRNDAVVGYDGVFRDENGRVYLVMEFVDGPSLKQELRKGALKPDDVRLLRDRLAGGLAAAHEKGVIHRDISPDNVILAGGRLDQAKIIDFGIAKLDDPETSTIIGGDFAGKWSFASPEQLGMYGGEVGPQSDMYSLGLVLAAAASGRPLDMGKSTISVVEARKAVPNLGDVPAELREELGAMLRPDPKDRPASMHDLIPEEHKPETGKAGGRGIGVWLGAGALVVALAVGGVVAWPLLMEPPGPPGPDRAALRQAVDRVVAEFACAAFEHRIDDDGALTIRGHVASREDRVRLQTELRSITGLTGIDNAVEVRPCPEGREPTIDVAAIESAAAEIAAGYDCADLSIAVSEDGRLSARGHVASRDDLRSLQAALGGIDGVSGLENAVAVQPCPVAPEPQTIRAAIAEIVEGFACTEVSTRLGRDNRVSVEGRIGTAEDRRRLEQRIAAVHGVAGVDMDAVVEACPPPVDRVAIRTEMDRILGGFGECAELNAQLRDDLTVTVSGRLGTEAELGRLRRALGRIEGVTDVQPSVRVEACRTQPPEVPVEPGPPDRIAAEAQRIVGRFRCSELDVQVSDRGTIRVAGLVARDRDRDRLRSQLARIEGAAAVETDVDIRPWPFCELVPVVRALQAPAGAEPRIAANQPDATYRAGDPLVFEVTAGRAFGGHLYVDLIDADGNVLHLLPTPERTDNAVRPGETVTLGRPPHRTYEARPPFGQAMVLAVVTQEPLFETLRPMVEQASQYMDTLGRALQAQETAGADYLMLTVHPR